MAMVSVSVGQAQSREQVGTAIARAVDSLAAVAVRDGLTPALGVAVVMDGRTIYKKEHGMADATAGVRVDGETLWYLASTSKSLTGFGVSLLAQQGALRLDAPIRTVVPDARWHADARPEQLTLEHFLSHTHHLNDNAVVLTAAFTGAVPESRWPELVALASPSGNTDLVYSNFGYNVAAMAIDAVRPEGWKRYLEEHVYRPAGMRETFARVSGLDLRRIAMPHRLTPDGLYLTTPFHKRDATMNSAGGHLATLNDLARWTIVQMDSGRSDGQQVFPKAAIVAAHRQLAPQTRDQARRFAFFDREGWSAGWDIGRYEGERMVSRFGSYSSTRSHLGSLPGRRVGVVAMSTGGLGSSFTDVLAAFVYDLEAGRPEAHARATERMNDLRTRLTTARRSAATADSTREARQRQPLSRPLADFAGRYSAPSYGEMTFTHRSGRLHYAWGVLAGEAEVFDASANQMLIDFSAGTTPLTFVFDGPGPATSVMLQGLRFTRIP
jgi:CubicO group peptidase (beta-lactamase class C family)